MKRYFDVVGQKLTLELDVTKEGAKLTVDEIEKNLKIKNLREVNRKEYNKLGKEYMS